MKHFFVRSQILFRLNIVAIQSPFRWRLLSLKYVHPLHVIVNSTAENDIIHFIQDIYITFDPFWTKKFTHNTKLVRFRLEKKWSVLQNSCPNITSLTLFTRVNGKQRGEEVFCISHIHWIHGKTKLTQSLPKNIPIKSKSKNPLHFLKPP